MDRITVLGPILFAGFKAQGKCIFGGDHLIFSLDNATDSLETSGSYCELCKCKVIFADQVPAIDRSEILCAIHEIEVSSVTPTSISITRLCHIYSDQACDNSLDGRHVLEGLYENWKETGEIGPHVQCIHCELMACLDRTEPRMCPGPGRDDGSIKVITHVLGMSSLVSSYSCTPKTEKSASFSERFKGTPWAKGPHSSCALPPEYYDLRGISDD